MSSFGTVQLPKAASSPAGGQQHGGVSTRARGFQESGDHQALEAYR